MKAGFIKHFISIFPFMGFSRIPTLVGFISVMIKIAIVLKTQTVLKVNYIRCTEFYLYFIALVQCTCYAHLRRHPLPVPLYVRTIIL